MVEKIISTTTGGDGSGWSTKGNVVQPTYVAALWRTPQLWGALSIIPEIAGDTALASADDSVRIFLA